MVKSSGDDPQYLLDIRGSLDDIRDLLKRQIRPHVLVDVFPRRHVNLLYMRIRNVGLTPAYNISVDFPAQAKMMRRPINDYKIFEGLPVLAPGETIAFLYGSAVELFSGEDEVRRFRATVKYLDEEGHIYEEQTIVDIDVFRNLALEVDGHFESKLRSEFEKISRDLAEISRWFREKRISDLMDGSQHRPEDTDPGE